MKEKILDLLHLHNPVNPKVRIGRNSDGGYVIADGYKYDMFLSCGVGGDISFERDFYRRYGVKGIAFDGTVKDRSMLCDGVSFVHQNIGTVKDGNTTDMTDIIRFYDDVFIKMDIEGAEWQWIYHVREYLPKIKY